MMRDPYKCSGMLLQTFPLRSYYLPLWLHMWLSQCMLLLKRHWTYRIIGLNYYKDLFDWHYLSTRGFEGNETFCHLSRNAERVLKGTQVFLGGFATSSDSPSRLLELVCHMVSCATDVVLLRDAVLSDIRKARGDNWLICRRRIHMHTLDFIHVELDRLVSVVDIHNFADFYLNQKLPTFHWDYLASDK